MVRRLRLVGTVRPCFRDGLENLLPRRVTTWLDINVNQEFFQGQVARGA